MALKVDRIKLLCVVGARPNFMKIAPLMRAFARRADLFDARLVHTGQHYDFEMNDRFFQQLQIQPPDICLEVGSGTHAVQTAEIMRRFEPVLDSEMPVAILVVGDVNSTIACALVAAKKGVKVIHVEAGLRSQDRTMPEEINRVLTDQISDRLYVTEAQAIGNLAAEGISADKALLVGNVMIDTLLASLPDAVPPERSLLPAFAGEKGDERREIFSRSGEYALLTLHRPSNVDDPEVLSRLLRSVSEIAATLPIVFPTHPRTRGQIERAGLASLLEAPNIAVLPPQGYLETLGLLRGARVVLTDSGGLQEESTVLGVPCLTLRDNTERPSTITHGSNRLVGTDPQAIRNGLASALARPARRDLRPDFWDGHAAERIVDDLVGWFGVNA